jgi:hypothetical protein
VAAKAYEIGSLVRAELRTGDIIVAEVVAIDPNPANPKIYVSFAGKCISLSPEQITSINARSILFADIG